MTTAIAILTIHLLSACVGSIHLVLQNKRPPAQLAWLLSMFALPLLGVLFYVLFGNDRIAMRRLRPRLNLDIDELRSHGVPEGWQTKPDAPVMQALASFHPHGAVAGNRVVMLERAAEFYDRLIADIAEAREQLWLCFYIWRNDEHGQRLVEACAAAAKRGVDVRVLVDEVGSLSTSKDLFEPLRSAGGRMCWTGMVHPQRFRWIIGLRNHRKIAVIDGMIGYTGGINIGSEYVHGHGTEPWHDLQIRLQGPVVRQLGQLFAEDWHFAADEMVPAPGGSPEPLPAGIDGVLIAGTPDLGSGRAESSILMLMQYARKRIILTTPYFAPDIPLIVQMELAAARGVEVVLHVSNKCDMGPIIRISRTYYERLLRAGVTIKEYRPKSIHHTKCVLVDDRYCLLGSINLDVRSFRLNFEVGILFDDPRLTQEVDAIIAERAADASTVALDDFLQRPLLDRLYEGLLRSFAPII